MPESVVNQSVLQQAVVFIDTIEVTYANDRKQAKQYLGRMRALFASAGGLDLEQQAPLVFQTAKNVILEFTARDLFESGQFENGYIQFVEVAERYIKTQAYPLAVACACICFP